MNKMTTDNTRKIIDDFARLIDDKKLPGDNPTKATIFFRRDREDKIERNVWYVPTELLRFRKDNGRISSEVASYETLNAPLKEDDNEAQDVLRRFLEEKDEAKTNELMKTLAHDGQIEEAIITSDGFLINGNRRKMALGKLYQDTKKDTFRWMRVVILPGKNDPGGPPTLLEIERIENKYQLQKDGKAEYYNFDRALSMRNKIDRGMMLEEILKDDPMYASLHEKEFNKVVEKTRKEFLDPLDSVDEYLEATNSAGLYNLISQGMSDREGRWQAFLDFNSTVESKLKNEKQRLQLGIKDDEVGKVKDIAFKIIRQRAFPDKKLHQIMRAYPKLLADPDAKQELFALQSVNMGTSAQGSHDEREKDWRDKNSTLIIKHVKKALNLLEFKKSKEEPITTLENVLLELQGDSLQPQNVSLVDLSKVMKIAEEIRDTADDLRSGYYQMEKGHDPETIKKKFQTKYKVS